MSYTILGVCSVRVQVIIKTLVIACDSMFSAIGLVKIQRGYSEHIEEITSCQNLVVS